MESDAAAEKMAATKRAYADVILNMAKESAARILASERRALRFQQSLFETKEEALAMLLRLKSLMDSKMKDAENTSFSQFQRIKELEGQLKVAEQTIVSLREDLEKASNELIKTKSALVESSNKRNTNDHATLNSGKCQKSLSPHSNLRSDTLPAIDMDTTDMPSKHTQMSRDGNCYSTGYVTEVESLKALPMEKKCANNPDIASIIMINKEPEVYRNGCTQRIHAFEHNTLTAQEPHEQSAIQDPTSELVVPENGKNGRPHDKSSSKTANILTEEAKNSVESEGHAEELRIDSGATLSMKSISEEPPSKMLKSHCAPLSVSSQGLEGRRLSLNGSFSNENPALSQCTKRIATGMIVVGQSQQNCQNENGSKDVISSITTGKDEKHETPSKDVISSRATEMTDGTLLTRAEKSIDTKLPEVDASRLAPADQSKENVYSSYKKDNLTVTPSHSRVEKDCQFTDSLPQAGKGKFLKYTFQRMRKRGSSGSKTGSISSEKSTTKRKTTDEEYASLEIQKPMLNDAELPRNNRRLMQVARQLISLSEKRW